MSLPLCTSERFRDDVPGLVVVAEVWHVVDPVSEYVFGQWAPIMCSDDKGMNFPYTERRLPTCTDCLRLWRKRRRRTLTRLAGVGEETPHDR